MSIFSIRSQGYRLDGALAMLLLALATLWPALASAQTSTFCPAPLTATVAWGASVSVNVSTCDGPFDAGVSGPFAPLPVHGNVTVGPNNSGVQFITYAHNGSTPAGGGSDTIWFTDENNGTIRVNITISPPTSAITVSPAALPTLTAGTPFSQALSSSGGAAPYTYTLQSGTLPAGLNLVGGVLSGTPTQRGGYAFTVRSTDSTLPTADFTDKGYTGTVQNPTLSISPASSTAIQGAPFSQTLAVSGGVAPHTCQLETGSFPAGISISSACVVSGTTAAAAGNYPVTLRVTDSSTGPGVYFELETYTLSVSPPPSVTIAVAPASVSEDGATNLTYTVTRSLNLTSPTTVNITASGTAIAGSDYTGGVATIVIPAGATTATFPIDPSVDGTVETDETVIMTVAAGTGYTVGAPSSATGTLLNDDVPSATISVAPAAVAEDGAPNLVYTVTLNQANPSAATTVNYTIGGTAANGTDYATIASPLVIAAGNTTGTVTVNPTADTTIEADETVTLTLAAGSGYTVGVPNSATGTILNDDLPNLTIDDVTVNEGNAGITNFSFTVSLSAPAGPGGVTFNIATANGSATAGVDYVAQSLTGQTIPAGSSTYVFTVLVNGDALNEPNETFFVNVTGVLNAVVVDGQGVGTITNDDPLPSLSIDDVTVVEGNSGTVNAVFTVTLDAASGQTVGVNYATADGTATQPADYTSTSGSLSFTPGQTTRTITVPVIGETVPEANETFFVNLSGATNATISDNQGAGTITNDDVPVTVSPATLANGAVAAAYSETITGSGGVGPYSYAITAGALPTGVTLSPTGSLSGMPTAGGSFSFTITATDSSPFPGPFNGSQAYTVNIAAPTFVLPATSLAGGRLGAPYSAAFTTASGGTAPYAYAVTAGALPGGLTLNPASGAISGTPSALGTFNFSITATDSSTGSGPYTATQAYSITVVDLPPVAGNSTLSLAYNAPATNVPLTLSGGAATSLSIVTPPLRGTAVVSGTVVTYQPNAGYAGPDSFTYTATNSGGTSAAATVNITVQDPVVTITPSGGFSATVASAYTQTFTFNGGAQPWTGYQVTNLPTGLSITATTANSVTISGTPTQAGSFNLNVSATDSSTGNGPFSVGQAFALTVGAPTLSLDPAGANLSGSYNTAFSQVFAAAGGVGPYTYAITAGALPAGLSLTGATVSGTPTASGSFSFTVTATDTGSTGTGSPFTVSRAYTLAVSAPSIALTPATLPAAAAASSYSQTLGASGAIAPYTFTVSAGALPAGLSLSSAGVLAGTPTAAGSFNFTVTASDANGQTGSIAYALTVGVPSLTVQPVSLPSGTGSAPYSAQLTATGGNAPYSFSLAAGALPPGLTLATDGVISGTPTAAGIFNFTASVTDSTSGTPGTATRAYSLEVLVPTIAISTAVPTVWTLNRPFSLQLQGSGGASPYTFAVASGSLPAGVTLSASGLLSGVPNVAGNYTFTVSVTDANGFNGTRQIQVGVFRPAVTVPTNSVGGLIGLILLMLGVGALALRSVGRSD